MTLATSLTPPATISIVDEKLSNDSFPSNVLSNPFFTALNACNISVPTPSNDFTNASQYFLAVFIPAEINFVALSIDVDTLFATSVASIFPNLLAILSTAAIPFCDNISKAGVSLFPTASFNPSTACPTVLASVANLENSLFVPTLAIVSRNFSVFTLPP